MRVEREVVISTVCKTVTVVYILLVRGYIGYESKEAYILCS